MSKNQSEVRFVNGLVGSPEDRPLEVIHQQNGLVAWVGRKLEDGRLVDVVPVLTAREHGLDPSIMSTGMVLLTDLARDVNYENRYSAQNLALPNIDAIPEHLLATYGKTTLLFFQKTFFERGLSKDDAGFIAKRLSRVLKVNYLKAASRIEADGGRVRFNAPPTALTAFNSGTKLNTYSEVVAYLGNHYLEAESNLFRKLPSLMDRSEYFNVDSNEHSQ